MAVIPAVGVGLSAISTFSAIQQQNKQARAQEDALHNQELDAATRLELAKENWQFTAQAAQQVKDRELALNVAQRKQAMAQIKQQGIEQQLASTQSQVQQGQIRSQAQATAEQLMTQAYQTQGQTNVQNANELEQVSGAATDGQGQLQASKAAGRGSLAQEQGVLLGVQDVAGRISDNAQVRSAATTEGLGYAQRTGQNTLDAANIQAGYLASTDRLQQAATRAGQLANRKQVTLTSQRNRLGIVSAYKSRLAGGTMDMLNQTIDTQGTLNQINAQRANIQRPGLLSYAGGLTQVGVGAYQAGLFSSGSGTTAVGAKDPYKQNSYITPNSTISSYPPGYAAPISTYPPVNASISNNA